MVGKGHALENVRTVRLFRIPKYDLIYTNEYEITKNYQKLSKYLDEKNIT